MQLKDVADVIGDHTGRKRIVLDYSTIVAHVVAASKHDGFGAASWAPLAALVDTERFERVGNFKDVMNWDEYVAFLTRWAPTAQWECSFKRISEDGDIVLLALEERITTNGHTSAANSLSVYAFDADDRIHHVDVYLQMPIPPEFAPPGYEGVRFLD